MPLLDPIPSPVEHTDFASLEWEPLLALVAGFAASPVGRQAILDLRPSTDEDWITRQHQLTAELRLVLVEQVSIPCGGLFDPTQLAAKAQIPGAALEAAELQAIARPMTWPCGKRFCNRPRRGWPGSYRGFPRFRRR
jgi:DNA mismatch repair protein MutS2